jgi:hypothetical protein
MRELSVREANQGGRPVKIDSVHARRRDVMSLAARASGRRQEVRRKSSASLIYCPLRSLVECFLK